MYFCAFFFIGLMSVTVQGLNFSEFQIFWNHSNKIGSDEIKIYPPKELIPSTVLDFGPLGLFEKESNTLMLNSISYQFSNNTKEIIRVWNFLESEFQNQSMFNSTLKDLKYSMLFLKSLLALDQFSNLNRNFLQKNFQEIQRIKERFFIKALVKRLQSLDITNEILKIPNSTILDFLSLPKTINLRSEFTFNSTSNIDTSKTSNFEFNLEIGLNKKNIIQFNNINQESTNNKEIELRLYTGDQDMNDNVHLEKLIVLGNFMSKNFFNIQDQVLLDISQNQETKDKSFSNMDLREYKIQEIRNRVEQLYSKSTSLNFDDHVSNQKDSLMSLVFEGLGQSGMMGLMVSQSKFGQILGTSTSLLGYTGQSILLLNKILSPETMIDNDLKDQIQNSFLDQSGPRKCLDPVNINKIHVNIGSKISGINQDSSLSILIMSLGQGLEYDQSLRVSCFEGELRSTQKDIRSFSRLVFQTKYIKTWELYNLDSVLYDLKTDLNLTCEREIGLIIRPRFLTTQDIKTKELHSNLGKDSSMYCQNNELDRIYFTFPGCELNPNQDLTGYYTCQRLYSISKSITKNQNFPRLSQLDLRTNQNIRPTIIFDTMENNLILDTTNCYGNEQSCTLNQYLRLYPNDIPQQILNVQFNSDLKQVNFICDQKSFLKTQNTSNLKISKIESLIKVDIQDSTFHGEVWCEMHNKRSNILKFDKSNIFNTVDYSRKFSNPTLVQENVYTFNIVLDTLDWSYMNIDSQEFFFDLNLDINFDNKNCLLNLIRPKNKNINFECQGLMCGLEFYEPNLILTCNTKPKTLNIKVSSNVQCLETSIHNAPEKFMNLIKGNDLNPDFIPGLKDLVPMGLDLKDPNDRSSFNLKNLRQDIRNRNYNSPRYSFKNQGNMESLNFMLVKNHFCPGSIPRKIQHKKIGFNIQIKDQKIEVFKIDTGVEESLYLKYLDLNEILDRGLIEYSEIINKSKDYIHNTRILVTPDDIIEDYNKASLSYAQVQKRVESQIRDLTKNWYESPVKCCFAQNNYLYSYDPKTKTFDQDHMKCQNLFYVKEQETCSGLMCVEHDDVNVICGDDNQIIVNNNLKEKIIGLEHIQDLYLILTEISKTLIINRIFNTSFVHEEPEIIIPEINTSNYFPIKESLIIVLLIIIITQNVYKYIFLSEPKKN